MSKTMSLSILMAGCAMALLSGCDNDDTEIGYAAPETITLSNASVSLEPEGGTATVRVTSTHEFAVYVADEWLSASPTNSVGTEADVTITALANESGAARQGSVTIWAGGSRQSIAVTQAAMATADDITCPIEGYSLVWHDEFNGNTLSSDWTAATGTGSNGWGNNELQYYTADAATVADGLLTITLSEQDGTVTSSRLYARPSTGWCYGYFEARMKLPKGKGTWPAFWMMPVNYSAWPADGEIDIMEEVGCNPNVVHSTIHCNKYNNTGTAIEGANTTVSTAQTDFHTYALLWTADALTFYVDGAKLLTYANDGTGRDAWPFDSAFYPILNLAWGGNWGGMQGVDATCLPATLEVDYVRIFQK